MEAGMLSCPGCGAAARSDAVSCSYCGVQLATVRCTACLATGFVGTEHCAHCGAALSSSAPAPAGEHVCPHCRVKLRAMAIGDAILEECDRCGGVWVDAGSFQRLCESRAEQAAYAGMGSPLVAPSHAPRTGPVSYVACPDCGKLMQRINFARCSGVIVDVCKGHGTWFDRDELRQIVEFIRSGGLDTARKKERQDLDYDRQRLQERERALSTELIHESPRDYAPAVTAASELLKWLIS